ncbi:MAG: MFS transporter [Planctomycetota bacterium]
MSQLRRDLRSALGDGVGYSAMVGLGETFVSAFALAVGVGEVAAGLLSTVPLVAGATLQLVAPWGVARLGSLRRWVVACATIQGLSFLPLVAAALRGSCSAPLLFLVMSVYWAAGLSAGPSWNAWMEVLVPARLRPTFFAQRGRACHLATLTALGVAAAVLHLGARLSAPLQAFAALFAAAGLARLVSASFLARQGEAAPPALAGPPLRETLRGPAGWLLGYMLTLQLAVYLAVPFFTPFMLDQLRLGYAEFTAVTATAFLARIASLPLTARLVKRFRAERVLLAAALGVTPLSALWVVSGSLPYLLLLQLVGGVAWGAYELTTFLLLFETIPRERRVAMLTWFNLANSLAVVLGSLLGGALLTGLGTDRAAYLGVFVVSSGLRLLAYPLLAKVRLRARPEAALPPLRTLAVRPGAGTLDRPVTSGILESEQESGASV